MQGLCELNQRKLNEAGVGFIPLTELRQSFTRHLMAFSPESFNIETYLERFFRGAQPSTVRGLILSDENFIGWGGTLIQSGRAYAEAEKRLTRIRELLAGHRITMFMAIRSYDSFTASLYCETLRNTQRFVKFNEFRRKFDFASVRWPGMVRRFADALRPDAIRLWRYEDFRPLSDRIVRDLAFDVEVSEKAAKAETLEHPSFSQTSVDILEMIADRFGASVAGELINSVPKILRKGDRYPAYNPWDDENRGTMANLYEEDYRSFPDDIWLVRPA